MGKLGERKREGGAGKILAAVLGGVVIGCMLLVAVSMYQTYQREQEIDRIEQEMRRMKSQVNLPIGSKRAVRIAEKDSKVKQFTKANFKDENNRLTQVALTPSSSGYVWEVKLIERVCGCRGINTLSIARVRVDPETGEIVKRDFQTGVKENEYAKQGCEADCHQLGKSKEK